MARVGPVEAISSISEAVAGKQNFGLAHSVLVLVLLGELIPHTPLPWARLFVLGALGERDVVLRMSAAQRVELARSCELLEGILAQGLQQAKARFTRPLGCCEDALQRLSAAVPGHRQTVSAPQAVARR